MALVYITCKDSKEAGRISMHLLRKRLITCANIFPIKSLYWWKGKIEKSKEALLILKTRKALQAKVEAEIKKLLRVYLVEKNIITGINERTQDKMLVKCFLLKSPIIKKRKIERPEIINTKVTPPHINPNAAVANPAKIPLKIINL